MFLDILLPAAAIGTGIFLRLKVEVSHTDGRFQVPVPGEQPGIPVADTRTCTPTLMAFVFGTEQLDVRYII